MSSVPTFIFCRIMSDKYKTLNFEDDHGDSLLDESADLEEPREIEDQREEPTEDVLGDFVCGERDIFSQDSLTDFQLERAVKAPPRGFLQFLPGIQRLLKLWNH